MEEKWVQLKDTVYKVTKSLERNATAEAFFTAILTTEVSIRNSEILTQNRLYDAGVGIRVAVGKKVGFACTNTLSEEAVQKTGEKALSIARVSSEKPVFVLPGPGKIPSLNFYDAAAAEITVEEVVDVAKRSIESAEAVDPRVTVKDGIVLFQTGWRGVINSLGVDCDERDTKVVIYLGGIGEDQGEVTGICTDSVYSRKARVNPENVGESVGKKVCQMFHPRPVKSFEGTVIFGPEACSYQIVDVLADALEGKTVMAGRSFWAGKTGQQVASDILTVRDNGILENGFSSQKFDDEGYPSQNTPVIERGSLRSYLHDATSAHALKMENTGNASRYTGGFSTIRSIIGAGYRTEPEIYPSNLIIQEGNASREKLISEVKKGILVESMAGFAQPGSGIISAQLSQAFFIQNGEIKYPVRGMVTGVAFDWLNRISGVGNDSKQYGNAVVPSLRVENVTVVGE